MISYRFDKISPIEYRYFCIGFSKTATITLHHLFLENGLKSQHAFNWDILNYQCFSDAVNTYEISKYPTLDSRYPNSYFILNIRDMKKWLLSLFNHGYQAYAEKGALWGYPCHESRVINLITMRNDHIREVLNYFKTKPEKLIIVNIDVPGWVPWLSNLFNFKITDIEPKNVRTPGIKAELILSIVNTAIEKTGAKCPLLETNELDELLKLYKNNLNMSV